MDSHKLQRHYKHEISGYHQWEQLVHAEEYLIFPENMTAHMGIDEVSLSKGELYTVLTNKNTLSKNKKTVVAIINGTEGKVIKSVLEMLPLSKRMEVKEVTMDMARNMGFAVDKCFPNSTKTIDRFHVVRLVIDAMQHLRVSLRWNAIEDENKAIEKAKKDKKTYKPDLLANGDTTKELLARSKYLLYVAKDDWTSKQAHRAEILFAKYPKLEQAYELVMEFRAIYKTQFKHIALNQFIKWKEKILKAELKEFNTVLNSLEYHLDNILNYFDNRNTNANAESFNSKIKGFRANLRGVTDIKFFLFRLQKLFA